MTITRLTLLTVLVTAVSMMLPEVASAQETVKFAIASGVPVPTGDNFLTVTGVVNGTRNFTSSCMRDYGFSDDQPMRMLILVDTREPPAALIIDDDLSAMSKDLESGTRVRNITLLGSCNDGGVDYDIHEGTIASPQNAEMAFAVTPAGVTLTAGHEGVIGAGSDEFGIADAICVKQGEKAFQTQLISDIPLEAGDRLTDFVEVDYDPATGETMYACWLEY